MQASLGSMCSHDYAVSSSQPLAPLCKKAVRWLSVSHVIKFCRFSNTSVTIWWAVYQQGDHFFEINGKNQSWSNFEVGYDFKARLALSGGCDQTPSELPSSHNYSMTIAVMSILSHALTKAPSSFLEFLYPGFLNTHLSSSLSWQRFHIYKKN